MALDFPSSPLDNELYENYIYDATKGVWKKLPAVSELGSLLDVSADSPADNNIIRYDSSTSTWISEAVDTDGIEEGSSNLYFVDQRALDATSAAYDAAGSSATAEANANMYTDGAVADYAPLAGATFTGDVILSSDPTQALQAATKDYVDGLVVADTDGLGEGSLNLYFTDQRALDATSSNYEAMGSSATAESNANAYTDGVVADYAPLGGANFTGDVILSSDPIIHALQAATKDYVDNSAASAGNGITLTGNEFSIDTSITATQTDIVNAVNAIDTDEIEEGALNLYFTNQRAIDAVVENIALTDISNVTIATPVNGQVLVYNEISGEWENQELNIPDPVEPSAPQLHPFTMLG
jgi:hypothetical protein